MAKGSNPTSSIPAPEKAEPAKRAYAAPLPSASIIGVQGGSGIERRHARNHKDWLRGRVRHGKTWMERKMASQSYCPSKGR